MPGASQCQITARVQLALTAGLMALFHGVQCLRAVSGTQAINSLQFVHLGSPGKCTGPAVWASLQSQYPMQEGWFLENRESRQQLILPIVIHGDTSPAARQQIELPLDVYPLIISGPAENRVDLTFFADGCECQFSNYLTLG